MSKKGYYGEWGGQFIPEVLHDTFQELEIAFREIRNDPSFWQEYIDLIERLRT